MRINFFAGPGAGKSTTAARIFSQLKMRGISVEQVGEYVKFWSYQNRPVKKWDQIYLFGKQQQYEYRYLSAGVKNIVTDSPCFLAAAYSAYYKQEKAISAALATLSQEYDKDYPTFNIFLDRGNKQYIQEGRYQNEVQARELDTFIESLLIKHRISYKKIPYRDEIAILEAVLEKIDR